MLNRDFKEATQEELSKMTIGDAIDNWMKEQNQFMKIAGAYEKQKGIFNEDSLEKISGVVLQADGTFCAWVGTDTAFSIKPITATDGKLCIEDNHIDGIGMGRLDNENIQKYNSAAFEKGKQIIDWIKFDEDHTTIGVLG